MSSQRYTLDWRGNHRGPWTIDEIENHLETGEINSLYSIHVNGKWLVLRDFLEQERAASAVARKQTQITPQQPQLESPQPIRQSGPPPLPPQNRPPLSNPPSFERRPMHIEPKKAGHHLWIALAAVSVLLFLLAAAAGGYLFANRGTTKTEASDTQAQNKEIGDATYTTLSVTGKEIFPSALISTATVDWNGDEQAAEDKKSDKDMRLRKHEVPIYGDENGWLGVDLSGIHVGTRVTIEITADGFMKSSKWEGEITATNSRGNVSIYPKAMWDYDALMKVRQQRPINAVFSVSIGDKELPDTTQTFTLKSINDCPLYIATDAENVINLSFLFAAYVNENHPRVQEILKEALGCRLVEKFDGYQSGDPKHVVMQVFSIWNALQRRGIKYSNVASTTPGDKVFSQSVRFLDESIDANQANCVDGTVLMASVLRKIGIDSHLVLVPGHCFLAFDLVPESAALPTGLETTMLGRNELTEVKQLALLPSQEKLKEYQDSVKTFVEAVAVGNDAINKYARKLQSQDDAEFRFVSIDDARQLGIMPIPFTLDK